MAETFNLDGVHSSEILYAGSAARLEKLVADKIAQGWERYEESGLQPTGIPVFDNKELVQSWQRVVKRS